MRFLTFALVAVGSVAGGVSAAPIVESLVGSNTFGGNAFRGFDFTTPATGGPWNQITANFFSDGLGTTPTAVGQLYLFTAEYSGTPNDLATSSPFAVSAPAAGGLFTFAPGVTLQPGTTYFAYQDTLQSVAGDFGLGGHASANTATSNFEGNEGSFSYRVSGSAVAQAAPIPEPATLLVFGGLVLAGAVGYRRRAVGAQSIPAV